MGIPYLFSLILFDVQDHGLSNSSSKSSEISDDLEDDQMFSTPSLEVSLPQCENITSRNETTCAYESNKPIDYLDENE